MHRYHVPPLLPVDVAATAVTCGRRFLFDDRQQSGIGCSGEDSVVLVVLALA